MRHFTDQEIDNAMKRAPNSIQNELNSEDDIYFIIANISKKYSLHIDQLGATAELTRNMLLGLVGPEEFLNDLIATRIPKANAREIMAEINQNIFVPLREQMQKEGTSIAKPAQASVPNYAVPRPVAPANPAVVLPPRGNYAPPPQSPRYPNQDNVNAFVRRVPPGPLNTGRPVAPSISVIKPPAPSIPTPAPASVTPPAQFRTVASTPPTNLPGAFPPPAPPAAPRAPLTPPPPPAQNAGDPYREPVE